MSQDIETRIYRAYQLALKKAPLREHPAERKQTALKEVAEHQQRPMGEVWEIVRQMSVAMDSATEPVEPYVRIYQLPADPAKVTEGLGSPLPGSGMSLDNEEVVKAQRDREMNRQVEEGPCAPQCYLSSQDSPHLQQE